MKNSIKTNSIICSEDNKKIFSCPRCDSKFSKFSKLKRHLYEIHFDYCKNFECYICRKKFKRKEHCKRHLLNLHFNRKDTCDLCGAKFSIRGYNYHLKQKHNKVQCKRCLKIFNEDGIKEHDCKKKKIDRENILTIKNKIEDIENKKDNFKCSFCRKKFDYLKNILNHIKDKHFIDYNKNNVTDKMKKLILQFKNLIFKYGVNNIEKITNFYGIDPSLSNDNIKNSSDDKLNEKMNLDPNSEKKLFNNYLVYIFEKNVENDDNFNLILGKRVESNISIIPEIVQNLNGKAEVTSHFDDKVNMVWSYENY